MPSHSWTSSVLELERKADRLCNACCTAVSALYVIIQGYQVHATCPVHNLPIALSSHTERWQPWAESTEVPYQSLSTVCSSFIWSFVSRTLSFSDDSRSVKSSSRGPPSTGSRDVRLPSGLPPILLPLLLIFFRTGLAGWQAPVGWSLLHFQLKFPRLIPGKNGPITSLQHDLVELSTPWCNRMTYVIEVSSTYVYMYNMYIKI